MAMLLPQQVLGAGLADTTPTFLQGRVNLPHAMYDKGYYVVGSFQVPQK